MQAHVAKESKSEGSTDRKEFRMSKVRGFFFVLEGGWWKETLDGKGVMGF